MNGSTLVPMFATFALGAAAAAQVPVFDDPVPYQSLADSTYFGNGQQCFALEFFPDGMQTVPGLQFNSGTGAAIVEAVGVPPGGYTLQANSLGVIELSFAVPPTEVGFVWTGGSDIGTTMTLTVNAGTQAFTRQYTDLPTNDPDNPDDNLFFGVTWEQGIEILRITLLPFGEGVPNQIDQIQFPAECPNGDPNPVRPADFNGDGWNDLVVQNPSTGEVNVQMMLNGEAAGLLSMGTAAANWSAVAIGNWGDPFPAFRPGVAWRNTTGLLGNWILNGPLFASAYVVNPTVSTVWHVAGTGDFDGNGVDDLVWQNQSTGKSGLWYFGPAGQPTSFNVFPTQAPLGWKAEGVGDFNNDGQPDLFWRNQTTGVIGVWILGGTGGVEIQEIFVIPTAGSPAWAMVGISDMDNDGVGDLLWQQKTSGTFGIWYMNYDPASPTPLTVDSITVPPLDVSPSWRVSG
jgi:hypothetical protein